MLQIGSSKLDSNAPLQPMRACLAHRLGTEVLLLGVRHLPHVALPVQVMPQDVDFRVMMTFLDFYTTLLRFVHFKLYHMLGEKYPPVLDSRMDEAVAGLMAIMHRLAEAGDNAAGEGAQPHEHHAAAQLPVRAVQGCSAAPHCCCFC